MWNKTQSSISQNVSKQMVKQLQERYKPYEWPKMSSPYRNNISQILNTWMEKKKEEDVRANERLKEIYQRKYQKGDK